ncbi:MAG: tetratricopeptide repeat protein, partial [Actinobacteria bacterium]|nr:tetratricopeptide repeat protein [Actinomycetota bacterium]
MLGKVRSGAVPPLADCFSARPETGPGAARSVLGPGQAMALTGPPGSPPGQRHDWPGGDGKTQLAAFLAESLWRGRELDLLVWATASRRASVQFSYARALAELTGSEPGGDAGEVADRFVAWLAQADRPWLVVLDDLADPADLTGLWPAGPAGRVIVTARDPALLPERAAATVCPVGTFSSREAL